MPLLIESVKAFIDTEQIQPFSIYSSVKEQHILNVPIIKPLLIFVLDGEKNLKGETTTVCPTGSFVFLSNSPNTDMRNIPSEREYFALLIEFELEDFSVFDRRSKRPSEHLIGAISDGLAKTIIQFIEWSQFTPATMWSIRRKEILQYLYYLGHEGVANLSDIPSISHQVYSMISADVAEDVSTGMDELCGRLAMSESTLRRRLKSEGTSLQGLKDQAKLSYGLHLLQTTKYTIQTIASNCGYQSQSRFTQRFKQRFGLTPTDLRKTKLTD
ncbi:helix-turn-helix transcriptional regulator [Marinomonas sp. 2405UD68-3]|uniref:helix-turn-helix transcriptional regulator n=1 Tax=Marinomonas sp. 2405UD68-3 TaxID=3391835 RepID=UPI0039C94DA6